MSRQYFIVYKHYLEVQHTSEFIRTIMCLPRQSAGGDGHSSQSHQSDSQMTAQVRFSKQWYIQGSSSRQILDSFALP